MTVVSSKCTNQVPHADNLCDPQTCRPFIRSNEVAWPDLEFGTPQIWSKQQQLKNKSIVLALRASDNFKLKTHKSMIF